MVAAVTSGVLVGKMVGVLVLAGLGEGEAKVVGMAVGTKINCGVARLVASTVANCTGVNCALVDCTVGSTVGCTTTARVDDD